jgi:mannosyltransferase OCH1-like enzyme
MKHIFQTWKTYDVPEEWKQAQTSIIQMNPTWKYYLFNDHDNLRIVQEYFPWFERTYTSFPYDIQRADVIRYMLMYLYGGIYVDLDYIAIKPFDEMPIDKSTDIVLVKSVNNTLSITNSFMYCLKPQHEFWLLCLKHIHKNSTMTYLGKHLAVHFSTGPYMLHFIYKQYPNKSSISVRNDIILPCNVCDNYNCKIDKTYFLKPIMGMSWTAMDTYIYNWVFCNFGLLFLLGFIILIFLVR